MMTQFAAVVLYCLAWFLWVARDWVQGALEMVG